ncbi:unnamed protein product [Gulo gulo]|uniref:Uncharacterized protein n=1 Tax=Gulo gulo TaxID=48420 RepID=A0A9X9Q7L8_GULGU|nr:unnamed protein product [Gulo gulo]
MRNGVGCMLEQRITYFHSTWLISRIFKRLCGQYLIPEEMNASGLVKIS